MTALIDTTTGYDLHIVRELNAPRDAVWRCWTEASLLEQWYCPKPWRVTDAVIDIRPGGRSSMMFNGPDGEKMPQNGMYLYVDPARTLIFTDAYTEGFVPQPTSFMTGYVLLEDLAGGITKMIWGAKHATEEGMKQHQDMGFETGWNAAADQLNELAQTVATA